MCGFEKKAVVTKAKLSVNLKKIRCCSLSVKPNSGIQSGSLTVLQPGFSGRGLSVPC